MAPNRNVDLHSNSSVLNFQECVLPLAGVNEETIALAGDIIKGDLIMLHVEDAYHEQTLVRAAGGLLSPASGRVRFLDQDWEEVLPDRANALRGRIGIIFRSDNWIPYQPIMQSMVLPQMHHTRRSEEDIYREASLWASRFGLPGLPGDLPASVTIRDRQCANLARAFIGNPSLILVEHQAEPLTPKILQTLVNSIREVRDRGAAVLWFTEDLSLGLDGKIPATRRLRLDGTVLRPLEPVS